MKQGTAKKFNISLERALSWNHFAQAMSQFRVANIYLVKYLAQRLQQIQAFFRFWLADGVCYSGASSVSPEPTCQAAVFYGRVRDTHFLSPIFQRGLYLPLLVDYIMASKFLGLLPSNERFLGWQSRLFIYPSIELLLYLYTTPFYNAQNPD